MIFQKKRAYRSIAIVGAGAVGGYIAARLFLSKADVFLVVRPQQKDLCPQASFLLKDKAQVHACLIPVCTEIPPETELVIIATKLYDLDAALAYHARNLGNADVLLIQNGVSGCDIAKKYIDPARIMVGVLMSGITFSDINTLEEQIPGGLIIGAPDNDTHVRLDCCKELLSLALPTFLTNDIYGALHAKLFVNDIHAIPAILGLSFYDTYQDESLAKLAMRMRREAYAVISAIGIRLKDLPAFSVNIIQRSVTLSLEQATAEFMQVLRHDRFRNFRGSIQNSLRKKRKTEINYIHGFIVNKAAQQGIPVPIHQQIIQCIQRIEQGRAFYTKMEFLDELKES